MSHETPRSLEKDGFRALVSVDAGQVVLRSRRGTEMATSFPEVVAGAVQLPDATALDGELVVWDATGRLAFERLQNRLARRAAEAARAAQEWPAHFVAFDLLRLSGTDTTSWPYRRRRAALESVFAARHLLAPWALSPSTTEADVVREWLTWASVGMEGALQEAGRRLSAVGEGLREIQGPRDERGDRRRSHRPSGRSPHAAARQIQGKSERADLVDFQLDDRSQSGITNIWLVWTIKNNSSEKSNYSWDWEAVNASGTRVANGSQLETDVQPGQTAKGEFPTTLKSADGIKLNITNFNRTAGY